MPSLTLRVAGDPYPQGSIQYKGLRGRKPVLVHRPGVYTWREAIVAAWKREQPRGWAPLDVPVTFSADFYLVRPKRPRFDVGATEPDSDKLLRSTYDGLEQAGVLRNDSRIWRIREVAQLYAVGRQPGAEIRLEWD